jgi:hypothetical protein|nr:MAG TPA: hypothetical protein [Caudoviricetes sp.]
MGIIFISLLTTVVMFAAVSFVAHLFGYDQEED